MEAGLGGSEEDIKALFDFLAARPEELVLDHIVERKRLDDLCSSIIDGRFREQKVLSLPMPRFSIDKATSSRGLQSHPF